MPSCAFLIYADFVWADDIIVLFVALISIATVACLVVSDIGAAAGAAAAAVLSIFYLLIQLFDT